LPLILINIFNLSLNSQTLRLLDLNTSKYPQINGKLYALDEKAKAYQDITKDDILILENGIPRVVDSIICPPPTNEKLAISVVLTIDVSESMAINQGLVIARTAAKEWILNKDPRPLGEEIAITSFANQSKIETDFTNNGITLNNKIDSLQLGGGTNFNNAFLDETAGSLSLFKNAQFIKRAIIFLTDGNGEINPDEIIKKANEQNITIYCVSVNVFIPEALKLISEKTGGKYFSNIKTEQNIKDIYRIIRQVFQNQDECQIYWQSGGCLTGKDVQLNIPKYSLTTNFSFNNSEEILPKFEIIPNEFYVFDNVAPLQTGTKVLEIKAINDNIRIDSIVSNNRFFRIISFQNNKKLPLLLGLNQLLKFNVEFAPIDSTYNFATFTIYGSSCLNNEFYCVGGNSGVPPLNSSIRVIHPNGGEEFLANSKSYIAWEGTFGNNNNINLELSTNAGLSWKLIADNLSKRLYENWQIPDINSDQCLVKVTQFSSEFGRKILSLNTSGSTVNDLDWSPDGNLLMVANQDSLIRIYSTIAGMNILETKAHNSTVNCIKWSPDAVRFITGGSDSTIKVWNFITRKVLNSIKLDIDLVKAIDWSPDGKLIAAALGDSTVRVYNTINYNQVHSYKQKAIQNTVKFSNNSQYLAFAGVDKEINIFSANVLQNKITTLMGHVSPITSISWKSDDSEIASSSEGPEFIVKIWDVKNKIEKVSYDDRHQVTITSIDWSAKNNYIVSTGVDASVHIWDPKDGKTIYNFRNISWAHNVVKWSGDGSRVATGFLGINVKDKVNIYSIAKFPLLQGVSNNLFSINKPDFKLNNIVFDDTKLFDINDRNFDNVIDYSGNIIIRIDSIKIQNDAEDVFKVINTNFPILINKDNLEEFTFQFRPNKIATFKANAVFYTSVGVKTTEITGIGYLPDLEIKNINLGVFLLNSPKISQIISLKNNSIRNINIDSIRIYGNTDYYKILSNIDNLLINSTDSILVNIEFDPKSVGIYQSLMRVFYGEDIIFARISAEVINPNLSYLLEDAFLNINCDETDTKSVFFKNNGRGTIIIDSLKLAGNNTNSFNFAFNSFPINLKQNDSIKIDLDFTPKVEGYNEANLLIYSQSLGVTKIDSLKLEGVKSKNGISFENLTKLEFLNLDENQSSTQNFKIVNDSDFEIDLSFFVGKVINSYFKIDNILPKILKSQDTAIINLTFLGGEKGQIYNSKLILNDLCNKEYSIDLFASVRSDKANLTILDFKKDIILSPCNKKDTLLLKIYNNGKTTLNIENIKLNNVLFTTLVSNLTIEADSTKSILIVISETFEGNSTLRVTFKSNSSDSDPNGNKDYFINISKDKLNYLISETVLNFQIEGTNLPIPQQFVINNLSKVKLDLNSIKDIIPFSISGNLNLESDAISNITVSYDGGLTNQIITKELTLLDECGNQRIIKLNIAPSNALKFKIGFENKNVFTNQNIEIPIILENLENLQNSNIKNIEIIYSFNKTLLMPNNIISNNTNLNNYQTNYYSNKNQGFITQKIKLGEYLNSITDTSKFVFPVQLPTLKFYTLWGNDTITNLNLIEIKSSDDNIYPILFNEQSAELKFIDICKSGGNRLFIDSDDSLVVRINTTPNNILIDMDLIEIGIHSILVSDNLGRIIYSDEFIIEKENSYINSNYSFNNPNNIIKSLNFKKQITLSRSLFSSGLYFINIKSETMNLTKKIMITD